jgi:hypothetical protein
MRKLLNKIRKGMIVEATHKTLDSWNVGRVFMIDRKNKFISLRYNNGTLGFVCQFSIFDTYKWVDIKTGETLEL